MLIIWDAQRNENMLFRRITYESNYETSLVPCQPRDAPPLIRKWGQRTHESNLPLRSLQYKGRNMSPPTRFFQSFSLCRRRFLASWSPSQPYCVTRPKMPRLSSLVQILNTNSRSLKGPSYFSRVRTQALWGDTPICNKVSSFRQNFFPFLFFSSNSRIKAQSHGPF